MYKTSNDRRFKKNKKEIRRAFIDLVIEKGYDKLTISEITERADINRMTFYSHYESSCIPITIMNCLLNRHVLNSCLSGDVSNVGCLYSDTTVA